jgi:hypothetical protein
VYAESLRRMLVWGGGHGDYFGNEVYSFDVDSLKWGLLTQPSRVSTLTNVDPLSDGNPVSRHTYDGLAYLPGNPKLFAYGGSRAGNGYATEVTWTLDLTTKKWQNMQPTGPRPNTACCNMSSDYDIKSGKVLYRDPKFVFEYDPNQNKWSQALEWDHDWGPGSSVVVPNRGLFFTIGSGEFLAYDIKNKKNVTANWKTTGGDGIINGYGPGMDYDAKADKLVAWAGGAVWVLDLDTKVWTRKSVTGAPSAQSEFGTYGRFRYIQEYNVFILVNGTDEDVYFYKLTSGDGTMQVVPNRQGTHGILGDKLILEPATRGSWSPVSIPLGSAEKARVSIYDTRGNVLSQSSVGPGHRSLAIPSGPKAWIVEAALPDSRTIRSLIVPR